MIDRLRELLRAATPGPWRASVGMVGIGALAAQRRSLLLAVIETTGRHDLFAETHADAAYIAALDPDTIRELLDAHDRMAGALREMAWLAEVKCDCPPDYTERGRHRPADACLPDELRLTDATVAELRRAAVPKENR